MISAIQFTGYRTIKVGRSDPLSVKWKAVDKTWTDAKQTDASELNSHYNHIIKYKSDTDDHWQSPQETLDLGSGDCEDFAILKYAAVDLDAQVVIGEIKSIRGNRPHAWCGVFVDGEWLVMDNLFDQLILPSEYINWTPIATMWENKLFRYGREFTMNEMSS